MTSCHADYHGGDQPSNDMICCVSCIEIEIGTLPHNKFYDSALTMVGTAHPTAWPDHLAKTGILAERDFGRVGTAHLFFHISAHQYVYGSAFSMVGNAHTPTTFPFIQSFSNHK